MSTAVAPLQDLVSLSRARALCRSGMPRSIRRAAGLSLGDMAHTVGVAPTTILRWERGERVPRGEHALRYLEALDALVNAGVAR